MLKEEYLFAGKYKLKRLLGRGGFSEVWLAEDTMTNVEVAVKVYASQARLGEEGIEIFRKEFALVFDLNHTNLLHPTYFDVWENMPYLILPYCKEGSVFKYISTGEQISEEQCWNILHDVAAGLAYMHDRTPPLIHQDIKPDNILISNEGRYMITDFGISTKVRNTMATIQNAATMSSGTLAYMGPERFSTKPKPLMASDVWSLGAMMYELMTGGNPPFGNHGGALQKGGAEIPEIEETQYSDQLKQMVYWCMAVNTWDRPVARAIEEITYKKLHNIDITADLAKAKQEQQQQPEPPKPQQQQQRPARPTTIGASQWQPVGYQPQPRPSQQHVAPPYSQTHYDGSMYNQPMPLVTPWYKKPIVMIAAIVVVVAILVGAVLLITDKGGNEPVTNPTETDIYGLANKANTILGQGEQFVKEHKADNNLLDTTHDTAEDFFIKALEMLDQVTQAPGYDNLDNGFKQNIARMQENAKTCLREIATELNKKIIEAEAVGGYESIKSQYEQRLNRIKTILQ